MPTMVALAGTDGSRTPKHLEGARIADDLHIGNLLMTQVGQFNNVDRINLD